MKLLGLECLIPLPLIAVVSWLGADISFDTFC